jgi:hypothetical protein
VTLRKLELDDIPSEELPFSSSVEFLSSVLMFPRSDPSLAGLHGSPLLEAIDKAAKGVNVFVHCLMGASRSVSIVLAYLMSTFHLPLLDAFQIVCAERPFISPNFGFIRQLYQFQKELVAQWQSAGHSGPPVPLLRVEDVTKLPVASDTHPAVTFLKQIMHHDSAKSDDPLGVEL